MQGTDSVSHWCWRGHSCLKANFGKVDVAMQIHWRSLPGSMSGGIEVPNRCSAAWTAALAYITDCSEQCLCSSLTELIQGRCWGCRGQVRFYKKGPSACSVKLTITYEVPGPLEPFASVSAKAICWGLCVGSILDHDKHKLQCMSCRL